MYKMFMIKTKSENFSLRVSAETLEKMRSVCGDRAYVQWRFNDAAIRLLLVLPEDIQGRMVKDEKISPETLLSILETSILHREYIRVCESLPPKERAKLLAVAAKSSGKKGNKTL